MRQQTRIEELQWKKGYKVLMDATKEFGEHKDALEK